MNNGQIHALLKSHLETKNVFVSVYAADNLPRLPRDNRPCAYIANTAPINNAGEHWVCFFFPKNDPPEYFDSLGFPPLINDFFHFLETDQNKIIFNDCPIQNPFSTTCGQHVIHYILKKCRHMSMKDIISPFCNHDFRINDAIINSYVEKNFNTKLNIFDKQFIKKIIYKMYSPDKK